MVEVCFSVLSIFVYTERLKYVATEQAVISAGLNEFSTLQLNVYTEELTAEFLYQNGITEFVPFCFFFNVCVYFADFSLEVVFLQKTLVLPFPPTMVYLPTLIYTLISVNISLQP